MFKEKGVFTMKETRIKINFFPDKKHPAIITLYLMNEGIGIPLQSSSSFLVLMVLSIN